MAKGYWIAHVDVTDPEGYKEYQAANAVAFRKYGGRFLVRGGASELPVGKLRSRHCRFDAHAPGPSRDLPDSPLEPFRSLWRNRALDVINGVAKLATILTRSACRLVLVFSNRRERCVLTVACDIPSTLAASRTPLT